jgi:hypothetical protein
MKIEDSIVMANIVVRVGVVIIILAFTTITLNNLMCLC